MDCLHWDGVPDDFGFDVAIMGTEAMTDSNVQSSNIHAVLYDAGILTVHFKNGGIYDIHDVPEDLHKQFMASDSKGSFFHHNIKGKFKASKRETV